MQLPYKPANVLLDIYSREIKIHVCTKTCIQLYTAPLFVVAPNWKQLKCSSVGEWLDKVRYLHTMEYHSAIKGTSY